MTKDELKGRTKLFALSIIKIVDELPNTKAGNATGSQLIRSGTSVAANYRSALKARSSADFISKITIVEEESDESMFNDSNLLPSDCLLKLINKARELTAIFTSTGKTSRLNNPKR